MKGMRVVLLLFVAAFLCTGVSAATKKEVRFDGSFVAVEGAPFGQTPAYCVERSGSCPTGYAESCVVGAGHSEAIDVFSLVEFLCINFGTGDGFGEYVFTTANGSGLALGIWHLSLGTGELKRLVEGAG